MHTTTKPKRTPDAGAFIDEIVSLIRALGLHKPGQTPCGEAISVAEAQTVLEVSRNPGISQNTLASRLGLEKSTVSRLVAALEAREWIERARDRADGRVIRLRLSKLGVRAAQRLAVTRRTKFQRVFNALPLEKRGDVLEALSILSEALHDS